MVEHSMEMIIGMMGILKTGGAYLPIDPEYPVGRIGYMLEDSDIQILLTQRKLSVELEMSGKKSTWMMPICGKGMGRIWSL